MAKNTAAAPAPTPEQLAMANMQARNLVLAAGVPRLQQIYSQGTVPANGNVVTVYPKNVGLIRGFLVKVSGTIHNGSGAAALTRTPFGVMNLLTNIQYTDMDNNVRINTTGWHLSTLNSAKQPLVLGGAYAPNVPVGWGNNWDVETGAATIADTVDAAVQHYYYVPLAYTKNDLRGAMWAGVVNATAQLQLTINPTPCVNATDLTSAVYYGAGGATTGWLAASNVTITVWQDYIDQIPVGQGGNPILPMQDLGVIYDLKQTAMTGLTDGQDFGIPYANFRSFLSTTVVLDNGVAPFLNNGDEVNYWNLQAANASQLFRYGPEEAAFFARAVFASDPPLGMYYFNHRDRPITTQQFGNMELIVNPNSSINAAASLLVGFESFSQLNQVTFASSLPNN